MKSINKQKLSTSVLQSPVSNKQEPLDAVGLIRQEMQYFSPFCLKTEKEVINEIRSLGKEILTFNENKKPVENKEKRRSQKMDLAGSLDDKINQNPVYVSSKKNIACIQRKPKYVNIQESLTRSLENSRQKEPLSQREQWAQVKKKNSNYSSRQPVINMYDKYKDDMRSKKYKKIETRTTQLYSDLEQYHNSKDQSKQKLKNVKPRHQNDNRDQLNYTKYINRNLQKLITQERQAIQAKTTQTIGTQKVSFKPFIKVYEKSRAAYVKKQMKQKAAVNEINKSFQNVLRKSVQITDRKIKHVKQLRQQEYRKQMNGVTFKPKIFTASYKSKNRLIARQSNLKNFQKRLKTDIVNRDSHEKSIAKEIMQETTFTPRINPSSKHVESITRSIWDSNYASNVSNSSVSRHNKSIERFKDSTMKSQVSTDTMGGISLRNAEEMKFLFY